MQTRIRVLIAYHQELSRHALFTLFCQDEDFLIVDYVDTRDKAIIAVEEERPDIILVSSSFLRNVGVDFLIDLRKRVSKTKIVVFNSDLTGEQELLLMQEGVVGILDHKSPPQAILHALKKIVLGECWLRRELISSLITGSPAETSTEGLADDCKPPLTEREKLILSLIAAGYRNKRIASRLCISEATVKTHVNHIFKKLGLKNRKQAALFAIKCNHTLKHPLTHDDY